LNLTSSMSSRETVRGGAGRGAARAGRGEPSAAGAGTGGAASGEAGTDGAAPGQGDAGVSTGEAGTDRAAGRVGRVPVVGDPVRVGWSGGRRRPCA
jgi:hypothetical protein